MSQSTDQRTPVRSPEALGQALARLRYDNNLTQEQLATALGVSRRYV
jgi:HTH-type transcriptional regulator/antitoxin HipB